MAQITIVGLGPGSPMYLTREAWDILSNAGEIWLRTMHHPVVAGLPEGIPLHSFDTLYEASETFEEVYTTIVRRVLELGSCEEGVIYGVPGHPLVGEVTVTRILDAGRKSRIPVRVVAGVSFIESCLTALELDALDSLQIVDALDVVSLHHPPLNPDMPALLAQVYNQRVASELKLVLMNQYPDEHLTAIVNAVGTPGESVLWLPLYEIDRQTLTPLTSLYITPWQKTSSFESFQETVAYLRAPEGCPWDQEQTHESLRTNLLEEAYEVLAAIDVGEPDALCEELGDLLLQVVLHAQIATEEGAFQMGDVIAHIDAKLKHRHPHVWGTVQVNNAEEVCANWEMIKREEREASQRKQKHSLLDGVPRTLPALAQAAAYGTRVSRVGLDWPAIENILEKVQQSLAELASAQGTTALSGSLGDFLFAVASYARWLDIDPESALREANQRFAEHFAMVEQIARERNMPLDQMRWEDIDRLWQESQVDK
ncbi:MAG: nucleoside triphosphate pyrophosphohydrolase [Anaerolineae bacterium]|nr:nucleoside triphosphate pyrophosphohydrolase [Anaerolineae bacterium]